MTRKEAALSLKKVKVLFIILGIILVGIGFYKYLIYENSGYSNRVNAYVGGDAYNYIVNGTYFIAYSVLGVGSFIIATITGVGAVFLSVDKNTSMDIEQKQISELEDIESNLPKM